MMQFAHELARHDPESRERFESILRRA